MRQLAFHPQARQSSGPSNHHLKAKSQKGLKPTVVERNAENTVQEQYLILGGRPEKPPRRYCMGELMGDGSSSIIPGDPSPTSEETGRICPPFQFIKVPSTTTQTANYCVQLATLPTNTQAHSTDLIIGQTQHNRKAGESSALRRKMTLSTPNSRRARSQSTK